MSDVGTLLAVETEIVTALTTVPMTFNSVAFVTNATNVSPIVITTATEHGALTGAVVTISGVVGNTAANGTFTITRINTTSFSLNSSTGNGAYASDGTVLIPSSVSVLPSMSTDSLIEKDSLRLPAIGVIYTGTTSAVPYAVGSRKLRATTKWRIGIACQNLRGSQYARQEAYSFLDGIRDRLHYKSSALSPKAAYMLQEEYCNDNQPEGKLTAYADYSLDLILGN